MAKQHQFRRDEIQAACQMVAASLATIVADWIIERTQPEAIEAEPLQRVFSRAEAAKYIGCSKTSIDNYRKQGWIDYGAKTGGRPKFLKTDLDKLLKRLQKE